MCIYQRVANSQQIQGNNKMKKIQVTFTVQVDVEYSEHDEEEYQEKLEMLIQDFEEMDCKVCVEAEEEITWD